MRLYSLVGQGCHWLYLSPFTVRSNRCRCSADIDIDTFCLSLQCVNITRAMLDLPGERWVAAGWFIFTNRSLFFHDWRRLLVTQASHWCIFLCRESQAVVIRSVWCRFESLKDADRLVQCHVLLRWRTYQHIVLIAASQHWWMMVLFFYLPAHFIKI